jgi:hypothetical protein
MVRVALEIAVFTLHDEALKLAVHNADDRHCLPSIDWNAEVGLQMAANRLASRLAPRWHVPPMFIGNFHERNPEPNGMSVGFCLCVAPSSLGSDVLLVSREDRSLHLRSQRTLAYTAETWLKKMQRELPLVPAMLEDGFTLTQFQEAVQIVTGVEPDKRHFRRQSQETGWLEYTGEKLMGAHRPAMRYRLSGASFNALYDGAMGTIPYIGDVDEQN